MPTDAPTGATSSAEVEVDRRSPLTAAVVSAVADAASVRLVGPVADDDEARGAEIAVVDTLLALGARDLDGVDPQVVARVVAVRQRLADARGGR